MQATPPVLTPARIDAMLSRMAEICMAGVEGAGDRLKAAPDPEAFERAGRALNTVCRNLRQTIAMKQRFDREQLSLATARRREADLERQDHDRVQRDAIGRRRRHVRDHFARVLWTEYEASDAQEVFDDLDERLVELSDGEGFLETPLEALIARLHDEFVTAQIVRPDAPPPTTLDDEDPEDEAPEDEGPDDAAVAPDRDDPPPAPEPPPADVLPPDPPPPDPPPQPPEPEPYIPPWERLRPGQAWPGASGW